MNEKKAESSAGQVLIAFCSLSLLIPHPSSVIPFVDTHIGTGYRVVP
jgi:hypothetical protein